jgi:hypothetical protein
MFLQMAFPSNIFAGALLVTLPPSTQQEEFPFS